MALPGAPTGLAAPFTGATYITLTWLAPADDGGEAISTYSVEYRLQFTSTWNTAGAPPSGINEVTVNDLTSSMSYEFRVAAVNASGTGPWSDVFTASTASAPPPPPPGGEGPPPPPPGGGDPPPPSNTPPTVPTGLYAYGAPGPASTDLAWNASTAGTDGPITGYTVQKSADNGDTWNSTNITVSGTTANAYGLAEYTAYLFRVRAEGTSLASDWSASLTYDTEFWQTGGVYAPPTGPSYPPPGYADISCAARLNELAGTTGESATTAANILAGTTGESLTTALNIVAGTTGESATTALNIIAGTTGEPAAEAARKIGGSNVNLG